MPPTARAEDRSRTCLDEKGNIVSPFHLVSVRTVFEILRKTGEDELDENLSDEQVATNSSAGEVVSYQNRKKCGPPRPNVVPRRWSVPNHHQTNIPSGTQCATKVYIRVSELCLGNGKAIRSTRKEQFGKRTRVL